MCCDSYMSKVAMIVCMHLHIFRPWRVHVYRHLSGCREDGDCPSTAKCCSDGTCAENIDDCGEDLYGKKSKC